MNEVKPIVSIEYAQNAAIATLMCPEVLSDADIEKLQDSIVPLIMTKGDINLILDFTNVRMISSMALGFLLKLRKQIQQRNGQLKICGISKKVTSSASDTYIYEILKVVQLDTIFDICENVTEALESLPQTK